jgi:hypothetical protein
LPISDAFSFLVPPTLPFFALPQFPPQYSSLTLSPHLFVPLPASPTYSNTMATQFHLPGRHSTSAPRFDPSRPAELPVYFEELNYLFSIAAICKDQEKKKLSRRYLAIDDSEYWETIPQYSSDYSFDSFKQAIFESYPGSLQE